VVELVRGVGDPLRRRHQDRHVLGPAAGHHRVDGQELGPEDPVALGDLAQHVVGAEAGRVEEGAHPRLGGRDHGQAVRPAALVVELDGLVHVLDVDLLGGERSLGHARPPRGRACGYATAPAWRLSRTPPRHAEEPY